MDYLKTKLLDALLPPISTNTPDNNLFIYVGIGVVVISIIVVLICIKHNKRKK